MQHLGILIGMYLNNLLIKYYFQLISEEIHTFLKGENGNKYMKSLLAFYACPFCTEFKINL